VVEADRLFGIGHVDPSDYAGYSGGWKLVVPGTAALETVNANHAMAVLSFRQYGQVGLLTRQDINEAGSMVPAEFFINTVINQEGKLAGIFAGSPAAVHQAGVGLARQVYEVSCPKLADLCVASAYPYDVDFYQAIRAIEYADLVVRPGGSILVAAPCPDGIGSQAFYELLTCAERTPEDYLRRIARREGKVTYNVLGYYLSRILGEKRVLAFMPGIPTGQLAEIGIHPLDSLQTGVDTFLQAQPHAAVAVMPVGSVTIPHLCLHPGLE
jgi:nickel-dependent lactate racemase